MEVVQAICTIGTCSKPIKARSLCSAHITRWYRNGDPLVKRSNAGSNHGAWKGSSVGYGALHDWVRSRLGRASACENCGVKDAKKYEWANLSGDYLRDLSDWASLCVRCHRWIDNNVNKSWAVRKIVKESE